MRLIVPPLATIDGYEKVLAEARLIGSIDLSNASFDIPKSETSKRSVADIYRIDWRGFFDREQNRGAAKPAIVVLKTTTLTRMMADTGKDTPKFIVEIQWSAGGEGRFILREDGRSGRRMLGVVALRKILKQFTAPTLHFTLPF